MTAKMAFLFPGQGSQAVGMLTDLADQQIVQDTFAVASQVLGYNLWDLVQTNLTKFMMALGISVLFLKILTARSFPLLSVHIQLH